MMITLSVNAWEVNGVGCPHCKSKLASPSCVHALTSSCSSQHKWGVHAVHTAMKRTIQNLCRSNGANGEVTNEDCGPFLNSTGALRMDTVLQPQSLGNCADEKWRQLGFLVDN